MSAFRIFKPSLVIIDEDAILKSYQVYAWCILSTMEYKILPCGCCVYCGGGENKILLCNLHNGEYQNWNGDDEEFVRIIVTLAADQMQIDPKLLARWA